MSATLEIIPTEIDSNVTFGNVIKLAEQTIIEYLSGLGMKMDVHIKVHISDLSEQYTMDIQNDDKFVWKASEFALFTINNIDSGVEAYCERISDTLAYWENYIADVCGNTINAQQISVIKTNNLKWYFRRAAGKSALVSLAYGHLAAATATLTKGIIHTKNDWDPALFPTRAPEFLDAYFKPEKTAHALSKKIAEKSIHDFRQSAIGKKAIADFVSAKPI
ncbi:MAG TPA: hypothetical protein VG603_08960 [Chitinophagales bacterium]|nr:hypothetical protein [Chitinophagales bacterium]